MACFVTVPDLDLLAHAPKAGWIENSRGQLLRTLQRPWFPASVAGMPSALPMGRTLA